MKVTTDILLERLPVEQGEWVVINDDQHVKDIIREILSAHEEFKPHYDKIAACFDDDSLNEVVEGLYDFCKDNIEYQEEGEEWQTTAVPAGILSRGHGDCKHYSSFIGGVLDGLNRITNRVIPWHYRFASYDEKDKQPHHVFIVAYDETGRELWIDPTPGANYMTPVRWVDYSTNQNNQMALARQISGMPYNGWNQQPEPSQLGAVDPATAVTVFKQVWDSVSKIFNIGDNVPNYPIKSQNTLKKLQGIVQANVPVPPKSLAEAEQLIAQAEHWRNWEIQNGNKGDANKTIIIMYGEVIDALKQFIITGGQTVVTVPGTTTPNPSNPYPQNPYNPPVNTLPPQTAKMGMALPIGLAVLAIGLVSSDKGNRNKRSVTGTKKDSTALWIGGGVLALILLSQMKPKTSNDVDDGNGNNPAPSLPVAPEPGATAPLAPDLSPLPEFETGGIKTVMPQSGVDLYVTKRDYIDNMLIENLLTNTTK